MTLSSCLAYPKIPPKIDYHSLTHRHPQGVGTVLFSQHVAKLGADLKFICAFLGPLAITTKINANKCTLARKSSGICCSWLPNSQIASTVFSVGTMAVLPFYTLMVAAPKAEVTKSTMRSSIPYVVLGLLYAYLLWLSWTPDTIRLMFASKYWLPELQGIAKMFSNEMTLASAWIHLLAVDLFAARQVYHDGLENGVATRHSVSLCLLFCPIGILSHMITKTMTEITVKTKHSDTIL